MENNVKSNMDKSKRLNFKPKRINNKLNPSTKIIPEATIFCKGEHIYSLMKQFKVREDYEIRKCERLGNFSFKIVTVKSSRDQQRSKTNETISSIIIKREPAKINSINKYRQTVDEKVLAYPQSNKVIKEIKPKHKVKLVQVII